MFSFQRAKTSRTVAQCSYMYYLLIVALFGLTKQDECLSKGSENKMIRCYVNNLFKETRCLEVQSTYLSRLPHPVTWHVYIGCPKSFVA